MRKLIWFMAIAFIGGTACKKTETEKAATEVRKAQEQVDKEREELRKQSKDVVDETKDVVKEAKDVAKQSNEVAVAEQRLADARANLTTLVKGKLALIDGKLAAIDSRQDSLSKKLAIDLHARRDALVERSNLASSIVTTNWDEFQKEIDTKFGDLDKDLDKAMTDDKDRDKILERK